ncbi:PAS domain-containing protein [Pseudolysobacter antarcticus]|uniref:sensor histidine kinase n=1 Tax=Pseudolysobacter antarcticus TaxID=2511995 RepID=UPI0013EA2AEF|nr:PAS domain-containing protein [Pseudolysobacter antarcticus]
MSSSNDALQLELTRLKRELDTCRAQLAATGSPGFLASLADTLPVHAWYANADDRIEFHNTKCVEYFGASMISDWSWRDAIHPQDIALHTTAWLQIKTSRVAGEIELRLRRFDGEYRWFLVHATPVPDAHTGRLAWCGSNTDIDDLKRSQSILAAENDELREEFRDLFERAPIPYVHEALDSRLIRANQAALKLLGIQREEIEQTMGRSLAANTPENQQRLSDAFASIGRGDDTSGVILEINRKDNGASVWVEWWSNPAPSGKYTRTMLVDITERVLMERAKTALQFTLESGQVGDWDLDLIHDTSRRSLRHDQCFGYQQPVAEAKWGVSTFLRHVHAADRAKVEQSFRRAIELQLDWDCEFRVVWPDRSVHWIAARARVFQIIDGKAARVLGIVMDITDRKQAEERLREIQIALQFTLESAQIGDWDLDLINDTSRRSLRHDQCFGYTTPIPDPDWGVERFIQHIHRDDRLRVEHTLRSAAAALNSWSSEFRVIWPDQSVHWLIARGSIYRTHDGIATRMLGIVMDITESKRAEVSLAASEQLARGQVEALTSTLDALATEAAPDRIVEHTMRTITEQLGAHSSSVWQRDEVTDLISFEFAFENGRVIKKTEAAFSGMSLWLPMGDSWQWPEVFRSGKPHVIDDIRNTPNFDLSDRLIAMGIITVLLIPMSIAGRLEGTIGLRFSERRVFRVEEIELAQALANQTMLAMHLTRLSAQSRDSAVIAERNRMARDIHDTLAQGFTGVIVQLEAAADASLKGLPGAAERHVEQASKLARESLSEARRSVQALRPQALDENNLCEALDELFKNMTVGTSLQTEFIVRGDMLPLPSLWEENLLRIAQEILTNVLKHAQATHFSVQIAFVSNGVSLEFRDNGRGFDTTAKSDGFGLLGMRERIESMRGDLQIQSSRDLGTILSITLSLDNATRP